MFAWIKKWWWAVAIAVIVTLLYSMCGSCTTDWKARYNEEKGKYEAYRAIAGADAKAMVARVDGLEKVIAAKDKVIEERDATIAAKQGQVASGNKRLADLEAEFTTLGTDKDAKISNLQSQVAILKDNLTIAYSIIEDKDAQIGAWKIKFDTAVKISDEWKIAYEGEQKLRLMAEGLVERLENRVKTTLFVSKLKNVALVGLAGVAAYNLIKK